MNQARVLVRWAVISLMSCIDHIMRRGQRYSGPTFTHKGKPWYPGDPLEE
jgi:hypothetical protein